MHQACQDADPRQVHEVELCRGHHEVTMIMNLMPGTSLDRVALELAFPGQQAFNVDMWAFEPAAQTLLGPDSERVAAATIAMAYYNLAVIAALGAPGTVCIVLVP